MKIPCWACAEPRDDADEFCPQCGAGPKPEIIETLAEPEAVTETHEETLAKFKADPKVEEYLEGVKECATKAENPEDCIEGK